MKKSFLAVMAILALTVGVGCGSGNSGGSSGGSTSTIDMAVVDRDYVNDVDYQVMLWLDVLANTGPGLPEPDMIFGTGDRSPVMTYFYNGDLYVAATDNGVLGDGGILIWRDYLNHVDGDAADVVLFDAAQTAAPDNSQRMAFENNVMVSTTWYDTPGTGGAYVYGDAANITDATTPDAILNQVTVGAAAGDFDYPSEPVLVDGRLFMAVYENTTGPTQACLAIWNDVQDLVDNGASAPDEILTDDTNLLNLNQSCKHITVANDILYLSGEGGGPSGNAGMIYVFNSASTIDSSSLPDNVLVGCVDGSSDNICYIESPGQLTVSDNVLWVANKNENNVGNDNPAVTGFFPADALFQNQTPAVFVGNPPLPGQAERVVAAGGALFITGSPDNYDAWDRKGIFIYSSASGLTANDQPTLSAVGDSDTVNDLSFMRFPTGIAVTVRGTFDNFVDNGT